jgi:hypothetical protein
MPSGGKPKPIEIGAVFVRLTVIRYLGSNPHKKALYECGCECGKTLIVIGSKLRSGWSRSCGCYRTDRVMAFHFKHGMTGSAEWHIHQQMIRRCTDPESISYHNYGGRGIKICDRWLGEQGFVNFLADMGRRPGKLVSIDRIDNDKGYSPDNCRWATRKEQCRNTRKNVWVVFDGVKSLLQDVARDHGLSYECVVGRMRKFDMTIEEALSVPADANTVRKHPKYVCPKSKR